MPDVADGDIFAVTQEYFHDGQQVLFVLHYRLGLNTDPPNSVVATCGFLLDTFNAAGGINDALAGCYSSDGISGRIIAQDIWPIRYAYVDTPAANPAGLVAVLSLPPGVAHALVLRGELAGARFRGTHHIGIVPDSFTSGGFITPDGVTSLTALGVLLKNSLSLGAAYPTAQMDPVLFTRIAPGASERVVTFAIPPTTRVMRRRTVGRGS